MVAARQIGAANRSRKERVADEERSALSRRAADGQADAARAVAGRVAHPDAVVAKPPAVLPRRRRSPPSAAARR